MKKGNTKNSTVNHFVFNCGTYELTLKHCEAERRKVASKIGKIGLVVRL